MIFYGSCVRAFRDLHSIGRGLGFDDRRAPTGSGTITVPEALASRNGGEVVQPSWIRLD